MLGSTSSSVPPSVYISRVEAGISFAYGDGVTLDDVIAAVRRMEAQRSTATPATNPTRPASTPCRPHSLSQASTRNTDSGFKCVPSHKSSDSIIDQPWLDQPTAGPADLIRHFCAAAISEQWPEIVLRDKETHALVMDVAAFAVDVAVRLAGVSESWIDEYRELTAHLRK